MTRENSDQATKGAYNIRNPAGGPMLREAPLGTRLLLKDGSIVEIIGNPGDGGWFNVRGTESGSDLHAVGDEEWLFVTDVKDYA